MDANRGASEFDRYISELCGGNTAELKPDDPFSVGMRIADKALETLRAGTRSKQRPQSGLKASTTKRKS